MRLSLRRDDRESRHVHTRKAYRYDPERPRPSDDIVLELAVRQACASVGPLYREELVLHLGVTARRGFRARNFAECSCILGSASSFPAIR
jgi:hypothetical protein